MFGYTQNYGSFPWSIDDTHGIIFVQWMSCNPSIVGHFMSSLISTQPDNHKFLKIFIILFPAFIVSILSSIEGLLLLFNRYSQILDSLRFLRILYLIGFVTKVGLRHWCHSPHMKSLIVIPSVQSQKRIEKYILLNSDCTLRIKYL